MTTFSQKKIAEIRGAFAAGQRIRDAADAASPEIVAVKIRHDTPNPDGIFEIMFMRREKANQFTSPYGQQEIISFKDGVALASQPDCCGGQKSLEDARRFERLNPFVQNLKLNLT